MWDHNLQYHDALLAHIPSPCNRALDVGCGTGTLARKLAVHCPAVTGIDLDDPGQPPSSNPAFLLGDILTYPFAPASFDLITVVATLHHLPLQPALAHLRTLLAPGGVLAVLGLYRRATLADLAWDAAAFPVSRLLRLRRGSPLPASAQRPPQTTLAEVRQAANAALPQHTLRRRLLFRYTLIWRKPS